MHSVSAASAVLLALAAQGSATPARRATGTKFKIHGHVARPAFKSFAALASDSQPIANVFDLLYIASVNVGDREFNVQLDTGSSDFWVKADAAASSFGAKNLGLPSLNISYGKGSVSGTPASAKFSFGSYTVVDQAFLNVDKAEMDALTSQGVSGILGLSFNGASLIQKAVSANSSLKAAQGQSVLSSIFEQSPSQRNYITFSLGRTNDLATSSEGTFTISEVDPDFKSVNQAPALPVFVNKNAGSLQRWTVPVDALEVAGSTYNVTTSVQNASGKQLALLDTGSSLVLLPEHAITAIYSSIQGSVYDKELGLWLAPCLGQTKVAFVFGGQKVYVHPLDITKPTEAAAANGTVVTYCVNNFRVNKDTSEFDVVLGDAFLRNAYTMYDFGSVDAYGKVVSSPFVKMLGVTDPVAAKEDFITSRKQALETLAPPASLNDKTTFAAVKAFAVNAAASPDPKAATDEAAAKAASDKAAAKATTNKAAAKVDAEAPKPTHKTKHKIGFSGKKGENKRPKTKPIAKPVIAIAAGGAQNDASDPSSVSSQVQKLLDFSPILLALLAANVILGIGLCILGAYIVRNNRAKKGRKPQRAATDGTVNAAYEPVKTSGDERIPSPLPYRDSVAVEEPAAAASKPAPTSYRDSGVAFGETEAARRLSKMPQPPPVDTGDIGVRDNSPFLDPNSPRRSSFAPGRDSIASDGTGAPRMSIAFPGDRLSVISPSRDSLSADGPAAGSRRQSRVPSGNSVSRDSVYSQGQGSPFRSPSHDSLHTTGGADGDLAPPQPAFAGGRTPSHVQRDSFHMPSPAPDSPNAQMPLAPPNAPFAQGARPPQGPGVGLRPQRQMSSDTRSASMYEVPDTSEHQLAAQQRRYSHIPPAAMAGSSSMPRVPSGFAPPPGSPAVPPRSPARSIPGPPPGAAPPVPMTRPPSV
ncbi:acid protease [Auricularia subglabra TFB-10046 SS5]|nr:acid protease [Auricularia subglabra TFB-10046 SS5]